MKTSRITLLFGVLLTLSGCASRSVDTEFTRCVYPDSPRTPAPAFVCGGEVTGYPVAVLRSSEASDLSVGDRMQATLDEQISRWVSELSEAWFAENEPRQRARRYLQQWLNDEARIVRSRVSPTAALWLLVAIPVELPVLEQQTRDAVHTGLDDSPP